MNFCWRHRCGALGQGASGIPGMGTTAPQGIALMAGPMGSGRPWGVVACCPDWVSLSGDVFPLEPVRVLQCPGGQALVNLFGLWQGPDWMLTVKFSGREQLYARHCDGYFEAVLDLTDESPQTQSCDMGSA